MPTGRSSTGRSGHLHVTLATQGSTSCIWKHGNSITRAEVLNLIQSKTSNNGAGLAKKGVCHKCNKPGHWSRECPENNKGKGRNGNGNERPKDVKSWKSLSSIWSTPSQASQWKGFQLVRKLQALDYYHATATHTGVKKSSEGPQGVGSAINNVSLAFDPSVWTTEIEVVPSVTDALFILRTMVTRILPYSFYCSPT
ncbi:hypothetical protein MHU86_10128 [Fragilaria crotonensis]|nr:hypothetical protein MHU86_10128 [Fragilaria crotonensis]